MYPTIYDAVKDLFGISLPFLKILQSFGFFVAIAFLVAGYFFAKELRRKENEGLVHSTFRKVLKGERATQSELITNGVLGFLIGYKLLGFILNYSAISENPREFMMSAQGNIFGGLVLGAAFVWMRYSEKEKQRLPEPKLMEVPYHPYEHVSNMTLIAAVAGLLGAKLFHILENLSDFIANPGGMIFSFSGLTMYGGLIVGGLAVIFYARRNGLPFAHVIDSCAPGLMLAYGVGRIGCHVAGDGDWGIPNTATKPSWLHALPDWIWSYNYPNNVNKECNPYIQNTAEYLQCHCNWQNTPYLVAKVYPTAFYEAFVCISLFFVLWSLRKRIKTPGVIFSVYLIMNGIERFFIEQIRENTVLFKIGTYTVTQAMFIAICLLVLGITGLIYFRRQKPEVTDTPSPHA
ncbi:MAG TPA: prolipoprotein diacylglyceryl transferase family protein [Bacteroidia bacterium]|jgi:phosphatidylglycerol:prolipoprotein diacylglycerol transferase|nr:prolipoprotein diacylglyceryl transferase family protein [Bacteroidia bacterium]